MISTQLTWVLGQVSSDCLFFCYLSTSLHEDKYSFLALTHVLLVHGGESRGLLSGAQHQGLVGAGFRDIISEL